MSHDTTAQVGLSDNQNDALAARHACNALRHMASLPAEEAAAPEQIDEAIEAAVRVVLRPPEADEAANDAWYSAAEAAVTALFALHPAPQLLASSLTQSLARCFVSAGNARLTARRLPALIRSLFI